MGIDVVHLMIQARKEGGCSMKAESRSFTIGSELRASMPHHNQLGTCPCQWQAATHSFYSLDCPPKHESSQAPLQRRVCTTTQSPQDMACSPHILSFSLS